MTALGLVNETIEALAAADAAKLAALAERASSLRTPEAGGDRRELRSRCQVLALLLRHTRRNLRLLGSRDARGIDPRDAYAAFHN